uniref:N-acetyltransferase domain-containing protein n=1 Tax=Oryza rufipogon TaxID=4529 RepID=A0A0E0P6H0_ORYRU
MPRQSLSLPPLSLSLFSSHPTPRGGQRRDGSRQHGGGEAHALGDAATAKEEEVRRKPGGGGGGHVVHAELGALVIGVVGVVELAMGCAGGGGGGEAMYSSRRLHLRSSPRPLLAHPRSFPALRPPRATLLPCRPPDAPAARARPGAPPLPAAGPPPTPAAGAHRRGARPRLHLRAHLMSRVVERDTSSAWFLGSLFRVDEARRYIVDKVLPHPWYRAICVAGADRPVGSISVNPADDLREPDESETGGLRSRCDESETGGLRSRCCRASVGYRVAHVHWGRGVVTRAVRATAEVVSAEWPWLERLAAVADVENPAGRRAAAKRYFVSHYRLNGWKSRTLEDWSNGR